MSVAGRAWTAMVDAGLSAVLVAAAILLTPLRPAGTAELGSLALLAAAVATRRTWPWAAWALGVAGGLIEVAGGLRGLVALLCALITLYGVTVSGSRRLVLVTGAGVPVAAAGAVISLVRHGTMPLPSTTLPLPVPGGTLGRAALLYAVALAPLAAAYLAGVARRSVTDSQQAAVRAGLAAAESARAGQVATLQRQRAELARDVHDVVGHSLAVIIAQADSVRYRALDSPEEAEQVRATVAAIAATARGSLDEIREVLGRLGQPGDVPAPAGPLGGGQALPELFARVRQAGVPLAVRYEGEPVDAGPEERAALVAVTRELLTNALRYGDRATPVEVLHRWSPDGVAIQVRNREGAGDGTGPGAGQGITGMTDRLRQVGGHLSTTREPHPDGTHDFIATAWVPAATVASFPTPGRERNPRLRSREDE